MNGIIRIHRIHTRVIEDAIDGSTHSSTSPRSTPAAALAGHAHTAQVACTVESVDRTLDHASGETAEENPDYIESGDAAVVTLRPQKPLSIEPSSEIPRLGSFAIRDMGQTIAAGKVLDVTEQ